MQDPRRRWKFGHLAIDIVGFADALDEIVMRATSGHGCYVVTNNVDHVIHAESDLAFRDACANAALAVVDSQLLLWTSRLLGVSLPEKISGSDLVEPLMERAARARLRVYLMGARPGVAAEAARRLQQKFGVEIVGTDAPTLSASVSEADVAAALQRVRAARPHLLLLAFGSPKQEIFMRRYQQAYAPAVAIGVGASLDFIAGTLPRAPRWISNHGLEWAYRLASEPRRLWKRYLVRDPQVAWVVLRSLSRPKQERVTFR